MSFEIDYFLKERLDFSRYFFETSSTPFEKTIHDIEEYEPPYDSPPYDESGEPPYLQEWTQAEIGIQSVGMATLSMIASALQLYMSEWVTRYERGRRKLPRKGKGGWLNIHLRIVQNAGVRLEDCPIDTGLLEQMILARNRGQHPNQISRIDVVHSERDLRKYPNPYFVSNLDKSIIDTDGEERSWWLTPSVHLNSTKLEHLIGEINIFANWLEEAFLHLEKQRLENAKDNQK